MSYRNSTINNFLVNLHENKKIYHVAFWIAVLSFSFLLLIEFIKTKYYYSATDGFYYFSIAKNIYENGIFKDLVTGGRIFTPQNGTVFVLYALLKCGFGKENIFIVTALINYASLLSAVFPLMAIMRSIGIRSRIAVYAGVAYYLCSWPFVSVMLFPQNEGLCIPATIWLIYLISRMHQYIYGQIEVGKIKRRIYLISCLAISAIAIHFRLHIIFVPFAAIAASLLTRKFKTIPFMTLLSAVMLISLIIPYFFIETDISAFSKERNRYLLLDFKGTVLDFCFHAVPESIFRDFKDLHSNVLYLPVYFCLFIALITALKRKEFLKLLVLFSCLMTYGLVLLFGLFNVRYLIVLVPMVYIIMLDSKHFRNIAYLLIFASLATTLWSYYDGIRLSEWFDFWPRIPGQVKFEGENPMLIVGRPRSCWFFTGISPQYPQQQWKPWTVPLMREKRRGSVEWEQVELYKWEDLKSGRNIYLAGLKLFVDFQSSRIKQMALENGHTAEFELILSYRSSSMYRVFIKPAKE